ncbi:hypothetical protein [Flavobacterium pectinovorum]|uniref:hypothetical protein n=1 Tax=Flavobacterium pectinovorum TaxID=29533 RepID=UPI001FAB6862|nr:hypothetical protein [Flavobacterium pectinovorum]MCI9846588.1 hypothetical protein [Flavobacterium pectinovorum]
MKYIRSQKTLLILMFFIKYGLSINAQNVSANIGLDTLSTDRNQIINLWKNYLKSNPDELTNNPNWLESDKLKYKSYDLLKSEGFLNPSLYYFQLDNKILSISRHEEDYIIKSMFFDRESLDVYAITNIVATKFKSQYYLTNYQPTLVKDWKTKVVGNITYHYFPNYSFNELKAKEANEYLLKICSVFSLKPEKINYFICADCENVFKIKGFDYVLSMGNIKECGFYDKYNNIIYATALSGENNQHEITHIINNYFPNANELLLAGISAYYGGENAYSAKSLIYSIKIVDEYLKKHSEIDLNKPNDFWQLGQETNPQYVIGALLCDMAIERGGIEMLKSFFNNSKTDEDMLLFIENNLNVKRGELDTVLRKKIHEISKSNKFDNARIK